MLAMVWVAKSAAWQSLIIRLIIQTIRLDPSGPVWIDEAPNVSSPDPSGADQTDAEHQATDLAVGGSNPSRRAKPAGQRVSSKRSSAELIGLCQSLSAQWTVIEPLLMSYPSARWLASCTSPRARRFPWWALLVENSGSAAGDPSTRPRGTRGAEGRSGPSQSQRR